MEDLGKASVNMRSHGTFEVDMGFQRIVVYFSPLHIFINGK